jgi:hypothetical protein
MAKFGLFHFGYLATLGLHPFGLIIREKSWRVDSFEQRSLEKGKNSKN